MSSLPTPFPFSALVGQDEMKRALLLNAVDPAIGGLLIRGERGTAKSTAVRALAALLPALEVQEGCPINCAPDDPPAACPWCAERYPVGETRSTTTRPWPLVELPVGATEDRVSGSFDLEEAIQRGTRRFEPGLLAAANRGILYVDEVNLLPDHLVDAILDAAASGIHRVEREGLSVVHQARFLLVGTMNPEEGELRPQLLDRFGLAVEVRAPGEVADRTAVVRRRIDFDRDPEVFTTQWAEEEAQLRRQVLDAIRRLPDVRVHDALLDLVARICLAYQVDGLRADIVICRAAAALAALDGRNEATAEDVRAAAALALPHRQRHHPRDEGGSLDPQELDDLIAEYQGTADGGGRDGGSGAGGSGDGGTSNGGAELDNEAPAQPAMNGHQEKSSVPSMIAPVPVAGVRQLMGDLAGTAAKATPGRARPAAAAQAELSRRGWYVRSARATTRGELAFDAMLRAAAPHQLARRAGQQTPTAVLLQPEDARVKVRRTRSRRLVLFVVDASGSMAGQRRLAFAKGAVEGLLVDAYQRRDRVAVITFAGAGARLVLPPTNSAVLARRRVRDVPAGGRTPLAAALDLASQTLDRVARGAAPAAPVVVLLTDGRANAAPAGVAGDNPWHAALAAAGRLRRRGAATALVETELGAAALGLGRALAQALGAAHYRFQPGGNAAALVRASSPARLPWS